MKHLLIAAIFVAGACAPASHPPQIGGPDPVPPENDRCRASIHQDLVGRQHSEIPVAPAGALWRISCSSCAVTMDYNPQRMNIVYDDRSGVIQSVSCG
ncbi:MAG: hemolysin [Caulobacterales bacterium]|nr:hemolysin [Caulobacterales bacterium]